jgi:hypothetical protein
MTPIDPTIIWSTLLVFLASPLVFLIGPVRKMRGLRTGALLIVVALYLIAFVALVGIISALSGLRG